MCLLVVCFGVVPGTPIAVAANRDERLDRPATSMTVLRPSTPAILGGRDELAGGTWLAVNEHGVVAGLTNRPSPAGPDPNRRSRGELPLFLASEPSAQAASDAFLATIDPARYNPAWLLVGDRSTLISLGLDGFGTPRSETLGPGIYILENRPLGAPSGKVDRAREVLGDPATLTRDNLVERFTAVLSDHEIPIEPQSARSRCDEPALLGRPICVHGATYGTRSATIVLVPDGPQQSAVFVADGRPCATPFTDETGQWPVSAGDA